MNKFFSVIIGLVVGIAAVGAMILYAPTQVAYGKLTWWDEVVAYGDTFNWNHVFNPDTQGKNMYALVHNKLMVYPENEALKNIAKNYGLTTSEAQKIIDGSITPIFNNPDEFNITQEDALAQMAQMREDFDLLQEIYELQNQVDIGVTPSEIFANNDLSDSGFDLVFDLAVIEEILFVESIPNSVGQPFDNQLTSPYVPIRPNPFTPKLPLPAGNAAILGLDFPTGVNINNAQDSNGDGVVELALSIGDSEYSAEVLEDDICADENIYADAVNEFEDIQTIEDTNSSKITDSQSGEISDLDELSPAVDEGLYKKGALDKNGNLIAPPTDSWLTTWCPTVSTSGGSSKSFGSKGFGSLGGPVNNVIKGSFNALKADGNENFAAYIALCVQTSLVKETVSSYQPGDSCVACEIENINESLEKTLAHSLIPNKVTGNILETAKCKDSYEIPGVDIKFIAIPAPVPTPSTDDVVFGNNIFDEWNKFVDIYKPVLFEDAKFNLLIDRQSNVAPSDSSREELLDNVEQEIAKLKAEELREIQNLSISASGSNKVLYEQRVIIEIKTITAFFENYQNQFTEIAGVCNSIAEKKYID